MWTLIGTGNVSKMELEGYYDLDEALKLYALWSMQQDIQAAKVDELTKKTRR